MKLKIGDKVEVLDDPISGRVIAVSQEVITIETEEGFSMQFADKELVRVNEDIVLPSYDEVHRSLQEKDIFKKKPKRILTPVKKKEIPAMEVDLHIHKLVKSTKAMSNYDMLTLQLDTAKRQLDFAIHKRIPKVVFIHGVGEGVLKEELKYMFRRYDNLKVSEADYKKYGLGALEVYIVQNPRD